MVRRHRLLVFLSNPILLNQDLAAIVAGLVTHVAYHLLQGRETVVHGLVVSLSCVRLVFLQQIFFMGMLSHTIIIEIEFSHYFQPLVQPLVQSLVQPLVQSLVQPLVQPHFIGFDMLDEGDLANRLPEFTLDGIGYF